MVFFSFLAVGVAAVVVIVVSLKTNVWVSAACKEIKNKGGGLKEEKQMNLTLFSFGLNQKLMSKFRIKVDSIKIKPHQEDTEFQRQSIVHVCTIALNAPGVCPGYSE